MPITRSAPAAKLLAPVIMTICLSMTPAAGSAPNWNQLNGLVLGRNVFQTYCAGCHGFDGLAFYPPAPSFSMGDRLYKSNVELMRSILNGRGAMPSWENKLPVHWLEQALAYIRHMAGSGNIMDRGSIPDYYFIFSPPGSDPTNDWRFLP